MHGIDLRESLEASVHPDPDGNLDVEEDASPQLKQIDGWWVICGGPSTDFSITDLIDQVRDERIRALGEL
jgi:hypothetical protein